MAIKRLASLVVGFCLAASFAFAQSAPTEIMNYGAGASSTGGGNCTGSFCSATAPLAPSLGGTGLDNSAASGVPLWTAGTQSILGTTGSGNVVRATSPTLVTPVLGTITSGNLAAGTGYTIANLAGAGTGVLTALGINIGSAGAPVLFNGAGGTPSSLTLTNATGCAVSTCVGGLAAGVATFLGTPSSANLRAALTDETGTGAAFFAGGAAGVFTATSLAIGGCTIGSDALCTTGTSTIGGALTLGVAGSVVGAINVKNATSGTINVSPPTGALSTPNLVWPDFSGTLALSGGVTVMTTNQSPNAATWATWPTYVVNAGSLTLTIPLSTTLNTNSGIAVSAMNAFSLVPNALDAICSPSCGSVNTPLSISANQLIYVTTDGANHIYVTNSSGSGYSAPTIFNTSIASGSTNNTLGAGTFSGAVISSVAGAASTPGLKLTGVIFTGGSGTTTFPHLLVQPTTATASTTWSTTGTAIGVNAHTGIGNLIDLQVDGTSEFSVGPTGNINVNGQLGGTAMLVSAGGFICFSGRTCLTDAADNNLTLQGNSGTGFGNLFLGPDQAAPGAVTIRPNGVVAGTSNTAGSTTSIDGSASTGTGVGGKIAFQTTHAGSTGSTQNGYTDDVDVTTAGLVINTIATDAAGTDATLCRLTAGVTGLVKTGSGTLGICLGTSGEQFKNNIKPMSPGLESIMPLHLVTYNYKPGYGDPSRLQYGLTAQDVEKVLPDIVGHDDRGNAINFDWGAVMFVSLHAIQQMQDEIDDLKAKK